MPGYPLCYIHMYLAVYNQSLLDINMHINVETQSHQRAKKVFRILFHLRYYSLAITPTTSLTIIIIEILTESIFANHQNKITFC